MTFNQIRQSNEQLQNGWVLDGTYLNENGMRIAVRYANITYTREIEYCLRLRILYQEHDKRQYGLYLHGAVVCIYKNGIETTVHTELLNQRLTDKVYTKRGYAEICKYSGIVNKAYLRCVMADAAPGFVEYIN